MADSFRWRLSGTRDQLLEALEDATGQNTKAKALDDAAQAYLRLVGGNIVRPGPGLVEELLETADAQGGLRAEEIAAILSESELPLEYEPAKWSVGYEE